MLVVSYLYVHGYMSVHLYMYPFDTFCNKWHIEAYQIDNSLICIIPVHIVLK